MWTPRPGTEADLVEKEVGRRKKIAQDKGLDKLFSDVYHERIHSYAVWIKNQNRGQVHPEVTLATVKGENGNIIFEFTFRDKKYKICKSADRGLGIDFRDDSVFCNLELFVENKKVFALSESVYSDEWTTTYSPFSIRAYTGEEWVADFKELQTWHEQRTREMQIQYAEDPEKIAKLKEEFGITEISKNSTLSKPNSLEQIPMSKNAKLTLWIIGIIIFLWIIS